MSKKLDNTNSVPNLIESRVYASIAEELNSGTQDLLISMVAAIDTVDGRKELRSYFKTAFVPNYKESYSRADSGNWFVETGNGNKVQVSTNRVRNSKDWLLELIRKEADSRGYTVSANMRGNNPDNWTMVIKANPVPEETDSQDSGSDVDADASASHSNENPNAINAGNLPEANENLINEILKRDLASQMYIVARIASAWDVDSLEEVKSQLGLTISESDSHELASQQGAFASAFLAAMESAS